MESFSNVDESVTCTAHTSRSHRDRRTSHKHTRNLTFLQDIANEKNSLKARIAKLEETLSQYTEVHAITDDNQQTNHNLDQLDQLDQLCLTKTVEIDTMSVHEHQMEVLRIVTENMELENKWRQEKTSLEAENSRLTMTLSNLPSDLSEANENSDRAQIVRLKLEALSEENALLKVEHARLHEENRNLRYEVEASSRIRQHNDKLEHDLTCASQSFKELELNYEKLLKNNAGDDGKSELMHKVRNKLSKLTDERRVLTDRCLHYERLMSSSGDQVRELELLRDELLNEISSLRDQLQKKRVVPVVDRDFREFVSVKRELVALREENSALASQIRPRGRAQSLLPMLKAPENKCSEQRRPSASSAVYNYHS